MKVNFFADLSFEGHASHSGTGAALAAVVAAYYTAPALIVAITEMVGGLGGLAPTM